MKKHFITGMLMLMSICFLHFTSLAQASNDAVANEIISIVKAQWASEATNAPIAEQMKNVSDDYTEFNPDYATRVDGKTMNMALNDPYSKDPGQTLAAQMLNPKVQVYGDVAILTYNYAGVTKDSKGEMNPVRAKSTRVYAKQGGKWMLVHANFAADPVPE